MDSLTLIAGGVMPQGRNFVESKGFDIAVLPMKETADGFTVNTVSSGVCIDLPAKGLLDVTREMKSVEEKERRSRRSGVGYQIEKDGSPGISMHVHEFIPNPFFSQKGLGIQYLYFLSICCATSYPPIYIAL